MTIASVGCDSKNNKGQVAVTGNVSFNGKAVESGDIQFIGPNGVDIASAPIENGSYTMQATPGEKKVVIRGMRVTGTIKRGSESYDSKQNFIPPEFNEKSTLKYTVGGPETKDFAIEGKDLLAGTHPAKEKE